MPIPFRLAVLVAAPLTALLILCAACASPSQTATSPSDRSAADAGSVQDAARLEAGRASRSQRRVDQLLVFVVENHSLGQMRGGMPYVDRLARRYGYTSDYRALTHPSLPNYLAIAGGSTFGVSDDQGPAAHRLHGRSVFGRAVAHRVSTTVYGDSMWSRCRTVNGPGLYAVRHNPWAYFVSERSACRRHDVPMTRFGSDVDRGRLPRVGMVVPNLCHDAHDCPLSSADRWLKHRLRRILRGPDWRAGHLAVVITADEDDGHHGNRILTVVAHPALHSRVVRTPLTHYALTRAYTDVAGVRPLRHARGARSLLGAFGLRTRH